MTYLYLSSGEFGAAVLKNLDPLPSLVLTQPDRLGGRGMKTLLPTPVKEMARELMLDLYDNLESLNEIPIPSFDFVLVADFGVIIPQKLLSQNRFLNVHPSLLPKHRGSSPLQAVLLVNEKETGVTIIELDAKMDHGPIVSQEKLTVDINDTYSTLLYKTAKKGADLVNHLLTLKGQLHKREQKHDEATYTKKLTKETGFVELPLLVPHLVSLFTKYNLTHLTSENREGLQALELHNKVRALNPWPGVWTALKNETVVKITESKYDLSTQEIVGLTIKMNGKVYSTLPQNG